MPANADRLGYPANATSAADAANSPNSPNSPNSAHRPTKLTGQLRPPTAAANASRRQPTPPHQRSRPDPRAVPRRIEPRACRPHPTKAPAHPMENCMNAQYSIRRTRAAQA